jgi:ATP-dependent helicase/nuclease subunit A
LNFTKEQQRAISADGNVLVMAGAGTGKTRTLVERAMQRLLDANASVSLDEILMVTFTDAAAAEMRQRIGIRLEEELSRQPGNSRLIEQFALLDTAHICTLHSFCLELVRQHFYELGLDPQINVFDEDQGRLLAAETLDKMFEEHYANTSPESEAVLVLIEDYAGGWERPIRDLILRLHEFTQTRPNPEGWFARQLDHFSQPEPHAWRRWFADHFVIWREGWLSILSQEPPGNVNARHCAEILGRNALTLDRRAGNLSAPHNRSGPALGRPGHSRPDSQDSALDPVELGQIANMLAEILGSDEAWTRGKKTALRKPLEKLYREAEFLASLCPDRIGNTDPLAEDWSWVRPSMITLLKLAREFSDKFAQAKRSSGAVDFHDLEQFALRLLWDPNARQPTTLAQRWREKLKLVFVDEYQDINAVQDCIVTALSRDGAARNRFLVGDVKQSIYRFRQAAPHIFQSYAEHWRSTGQDGQVIDMADNFRSHESILHFVNSLFSALMRSEIGGVEFDEAAKLKFGCPEERSALLVAPNPARRERLTSTCLVPPGGMECQAAPRVEIHLQLKEKTDTEREDDDEIGALSDAEKEARLVGQRLLELRSSRHSIWDDTTGEFRPVDWRDIVVLLRSPANKVEGFAKEFARLGIPLQAKRSGFFDSIEVLDLLNVLKLLDNPLQDVPAIAVLRSPIVGLSLDELAAVRLSARKVRFWTALLRWHALQSARFKVRGSSLEAPVVSYPFSATEPAADAPSGAERERRTFEKVDTFLSRFACWRSAARHASLSQRLELILNDTNYFEWLLTQPRGQQRQANIQQLLAIARGFDDLQQQGLYRFLKLIEAHEQTVGDREPAPVEAADAVRLMSVHQSKGLEFPVVVVADLGKRINFADASSGIILDDRFGLCPRVKPPNTAQHYPSIAHWLAKRHQREEILGEELRILYVALTRAQEHLILFGSCPAETATKWLEKSPNPRATRDLLGANSYWDWLGPWLAQAVASDWTEHPEGQTELWRWRIHRARSPKGPAQPTDQTSKESRVLPLQGENRTLAADQMELFSQPAGAQSLLQRLTWTYPYANATRETAKTSVTAVRRKLADASELEASQETYGAGPTLIRAAARNSELTAAEIGNAHHRFLQLASLENLHTTSGVEQEAQRLLAIGMLSNAEVAALNATSMARFWSGGLGHRLRAHVAFVERELAFTMRLGHDDVASHGLGVTMPASEFLVVQGVVDLAVLLPHEIWVVDFKTDVLTEADLPAKTTRYAPQLQMYALALARIYQKPVRQCWLHFFTIGETVPVSPAGVAASLA